MQLKKLTIHNIASIEDAQIDFSGNELGKAPIFLICGETGAGKTTILDAICLALYGETPRMTSVSKEELELTEPSDSRTERYYSNDNSQLLHRGAGEGYAKLLFTGNDDRDYEALWEVHRAHNKAHKRLLRPTRALAAVDGSYSENRINEIKNKVVELTGLEYDQFCRTVMLAQGEFTKFLKSNKAEKSEILEKLTGTEIYSMLGIKIAEHYNAAKLEWQKNKEDVERIHLLTDDEIKNLEARREEITVSVAALTERRGKIGDKLVWLTTSENNEKVRKQIDADVAMLEESLKSESYRQDRILVRDYEASGEGRAVLDNLAKNELEIKKIQKLLPELQNEKIRMETVEKEVVEKGKAVEKAVADNEGSLEKIDLDGLTKRYHELVGRDNLLSGILTRAEKLRGEENSLSILNGQHMDLRQRRDDNERKAELLRGPVEDAGKDLAEWTEKLDKAEVSVSEMVKDIRSRLKKGDRCPVCGSDVKDEITDSYFESLLTPIRESKEKAEVTYLNLKSNEETARKLVATDERSIKKLEGRLKTATDAVRITRSEIEIVKNQAGLSDLSYDELSEACTKERDMLKVELDTIRAKQKQGEALQKEIRKLRRKLKEVNVSIDKAKGDVMATSIAFKEGEARLTAAEYTRDGLWESLRMFFINNPEISMSRLKELVPHNPKDIQILKLRLDTVEDKLKNEKGKLEAVTASIAAHDAQKPEFDETDTKEYLEKTLEEVETAVKKLSEENGGIGEALERDRKQRGEYTARQAELEKSRLSLEKWEGLYNKLGDLKGVKFRAIAQSFILRSLLDSANIYMHSFSDRYTLTCNPGTLTILVKDGYKPSEAQPASILSGGESFMASLSLALALSHLRSGGMAVDILFIDEGFGTLSAEYLGNVMNTLEKLHQIGGRKVGLISHVAEMKERIPVQIRVHRESPALSRVDIVETY